MDLFHRFHWYTEFKERCVRFFRLRTQPIDGAVCSDNTVQPLVRPSVGAPVRTPTMAGGPVYELLLRPPSSITMGPSYLSSPDRFVDCRSSIADAHRSNCAQERTSNHRGLVQSSSLMVGNRSVTYIHSSSFITLRRTVVPRQRKGIRRIQRPATVLIVEPLGRLNPTYEDDHVSHETNATSIVSPENL